MLLFERPPRPTDFDDKMSARRREVRNAVEARRKPTFDDGTWKAYKAHFADAQHGRCGFCESEVLPTETGDVEHFRPKGEISELIEEGREPRKWASNVEGRRLRTISEWGYWWLAYEWTNWLFACSRCNSGWKRTLFPVAEDPRQLPPVEGQTETPLLLDPFGAEEPGNHLAFDALGQISPVAGSRTGAETIRVLGLTRESLRRPRQRIAERVFNLTVQFLAELDEDKVPEPSIAEELIWHGDPKKAPHAGMVRIVFEQSVPMTWSELVESYGNLEG